MGNIFEELKKKSDISWYHNLLWKSSTAKKMTELERSTLINNCMNTSIIIKDLLINQYGKLRAEEYIKILGIKIEEETDDFIKEYLYMGLYQPANNTITINKRVINILEQFIRNHKIDDMIPWSNVVETVLYHEIFHAMEERTEGIYTRSKMVKRTHFGLFSRYSGLDLASEIGAIHFSKIMSELNFSPCIYEQILLLATDQSYEENLIHSITH